MSEKKRPIPTAKASARHRSQRQDLAIILIERIMLLQPPPPTTS